MRPSGRFATTRSMRLESLPISVTRGLMTATRLRTISALASASVCAGETVGSGAQAGEEIGGSAAAAIGVLGEEAGHALLAEPLRGFRGGIALEEGKRDRSGDIGEEVGRAGPEAVEQAGQPVGESEALGDQVAASADQGPERLDVVGRLSERTKAVTVGTQDVGEHVGIAEIALGAGGAITRPAGLHHVGVDRDDGEAGIDERVDDETRWTLDGDGQRAGPAMTRQARQQAGETVGAVVCLEPIQDIAIVGDHADGMGVSAPVQSDLRHVPFPCFGPIITRAGRPCGSLIDRRSGWQAVALHPVVRSVLPAPAARRVSCGPSSGKRAWPWQRALGWAHQ